MARSTHSSSSSAYSWRKVPLAPLVLLYGPEDYFASRAQQQLKAQFAQAEGSFELSELSAKDYQAGQLALLTSPSLFDEPKVIEVGQLSSMSEAFLTDALAYIDAPADRTLLILRHSGGNRGKKLLTALKGRYPLVECKSLKNERDRIDFISQEFKARRHPIDRPALEALALASSDLAELASAIDQLASDQPGPISLDIVDRFFGGRAEVTAFKVADAALAGQSRQAIKLLRQAIDSGNDPLALLGALASKVRTIARVHGRTEGSQLLAAELKLAAWQVESAQREARRIRAEDLVKIISLLSEADAQLKGENLDALYPLERAVLAISRLRAGS